MECRLFCRPEVAAGDYPLDARSPGFGFAGNAPTHHRTQIGVYSALTRRLGRISCLNQAVALVEYI